MTHSAVARRVQRWWWRDAAAIRGWPVGARALVRRLIVRHSRRSRLSRNESLKRNALAVTPRIR
jgi:hypothetical protein